jgi:hypothetical protein
MTYELRLFMKGKSVNDREDGTQMVSTGSYSEERPGMHFENAAAKIEAFLAGAGGQDFVQITLTREAPKEKKPTTEKRERFSTEPVTLGEDG